VKERINGKDIEIKQSFLTEYRFSFLSRGSDGSIKLRAVYEKLRLDMKSPSGDISFDSSKPGTSGTNLNALRALEGGGFDFVLGPDLKVREIDGLSALAARIASAAKDPALATTASQFMNDGAIRQSLDSMFGVFPAARPEIGGSWSVESSAIGIVPVTSRLKMSAVKVEGSQVEVKVTGDIASEGNASLKGKITGNLILDVDALRILSGGLSQEIEGSIHVGNVSVPISIYGTTVYR
jgi:hypothetical protein